MSDSNFVVIDTETTGFGKKDKILEISVITVSSKNGEIVDEFDTLVNPMRDISNSNIHGITASMVSAAPDFEEISIALGNILQGNILVAHNLPFDSRMLLQEFSKFSGKFNLGTGVCTLKLTNTKLETACKNFGVAMEGAHRALHDARATANLLGHLDLSDLEINPVLIEGLEGHWNPRTLRREHLSNSDLGITTRSTRTLYFPTSKAEEAAYLDVLDYFFEDSKITEDELSNLRDLATDLNLDKSRVKDLHYDYLMTLYSAAMRDGVLTELELSLINELVRAFELRDFKLPATTSTPENRELAVGASICFTGSAFINGEEMPRERLEAIAAAAGFHPVSSVTKKGCDLLVAADPMSMSGKAKKARTFEIPVIGVKDFVEFPEVKAKTLLKNMRPDWF